MFSAIVSKIPVNNPYSIVGYSDDTKTPILNLEVAMDTATAQLHERLSTLEQENTLLRSRLQSCEQACALLQLNVNRSLEHRLLEATAIAANALLTITPFDQAVNTALQIMGEALETDRICLGEHHDDESGKTLGFVRYSYEWTSPYTFSQIQLPGAADVSYAGIEAEYELLCQGQGVGGLVDKFSEPFRSEQKALGVKSGYATPIMIKGQYWGILGFDDCREAKHRTPAELAVLKIAADCIGSAIQHQRTQQILLEAEQTRVAELAKANAELLQREHDVQRSYRLLSTVAQITKDLLEAEDIDTVIPVVLQAVGKSTNMSRVMLIRERQNPVTQKLQHCVEYEWVAPGIADHATVGLAIMDNEFFWTLIDPLYAGQSIWRAIDDLPEVTRSQFERLNIQSTGVVPIFIEGRYIGCIAFDDCPTPRQWTQQEIDVLTAAAESIGAALHRKQLVDRLVQERIQAEQERVAELVKANDALRRSVGHLTTTDNLSRFLIATLQEATQSSGAASGAIFVYQAAHHTLQMTALVLHGEVIDIATDPRAALWRSPISADLTSVWQRIQNQQLIWLDLNQSSQDVWQFAVSWHRQQGHKTIPMIPLSIGEQALGFMGLAFTTEQPPTEFRFEQCRTFAHYAALALQIADLMQQAKQSAVLEERNRMASEIHDTLAQAFTGISLQLEVAKPLVHQHPQTAQQILDHISRLAETGLTEARRSVWALYPPAAEYADLAQLLYNSVEQLTRNTATTIEVNLQGTPCSLPPFIGMNLLRIGQEAITNALKHAQAQMITIELVYECDRVCLTIRDNGRGFVPPTTIDPLNGGFGLMGMYERCDRMGAQLSFNSQPGQGTQILVEVPFS